MRRQSWGAGLVLVLAAPGCALDRRGTEFSASPLVEDQPLDAGIARPDPAPDATPRVDAGSEGDLGAVSSLEGAAPPDEDASADGGLPVTPPALDSSMTAASAMTSTDGAFGPDDASPPEAAVPADSCDRDGDGHLAAGPPCFGDDCCDTDPHVHPGQTGYFTQPSACGNYDYDCDLAETPQYGQVNCVSIGVTCGGDGFDQTTACGVEAPFSVCTASGILACTASVGSLTQACR